MLLCTRVLFRKFDTDKAKTEVDRMVPRNDFLSKVDGLRPHLHEYFNYMLRVDKATGTVPGHMLAYEFASLSERALLSQVTSFSLDTADFVKAPHGMLGWQHRKDSLLAARYINPVDYYCSTGTVLEIAEFVTLLLECVGISRVLTGAAVGYTFKSFCDFYISKLRLAAQLPLLEEQYDHLQKCDEQFRAFLTVAKVTLTDAVHNGDVGSKDFNVALIQADAEPVTRLNRLETDINTRSQMRASLGSMLPTPNKPRGVNDIDLLRLSDPANTAASTKKKKRKSHTHGDGSCEDQSMLAWIQEEDERDAQDQGRGGDDKAKEGMPPGCMVDSWRYLNKEKTLLLISGYVWDLKDLSKALSMPLKGPCWPFLLTRATAQNRPSRCDKWGQQGHENAKSAAHKFSIDLDTASKKYARVATKDEKQGLQVSPDWDAIKESKGKGKGRGKGGRGKGRGREARGRGGRSGQRFGQPLSP